MSYGISISIFRHRYVHIGFGLDALGVIHTYDVGFCDCSLLAIRAVEGLGTRDEQVQPPASFLLYLIQYAESGEAGGKEDNMKKFCCFCNWFCIVLVCILLLVSFLKILGCQCVQTIDGGSIAAFISAVGILTAFKEYNLKKDRDKTEVLATFNRRFLGGEDYRFCIKLLYDIIEGRDRNVATRDGFETKWKKEKFLRFYEELYYEIKAGRIEEKKAVDLFGYHALQIEEHKQHFIEETDDTKGNWNTFHEFAKLCKKQQEKNNKRH